MYIALHGNGDKHTLVQSLVRILDSVSMSALNVVSGECVVHDEEKTDVEWSVASQVIL
jgi:hypothetical protein